ncbi:helix-turn-helix domain-containing protein [Rhizobium sullae]|uniref:DnaA-like protein n=1 Tax=Rhizobium sullae TaxID=50338 RepID=A0A4R3QLV1_RHISU|nr:helix-turn-helix domain-containing protein [Rhizobium sullae]TCU19296.1 DnaA-like protein [Rhizobium sullae]
MPVENQPLPRMRLEYALQPFVNDAALSFKGPAPPSATLPVSAVCRIAMEVTAEMVMLVGGRLLERRDRRRMLCHARQIAMYVCHVALQIPFDDIAGALGRSCSTVGHACQTVEERREDPAFDDFVAAVERTANSIFRSAGGAVHG